MLNLAITLNCRLRRAYCLIEARLDFLVWLEGSRSPSTVGPAAEFILIKTVRSESLSEPTVKWGGDDNILICCDRLFFA